jgi:hypothetical protein
MAILNKSSVARLMKTIRWLIKNTLKATVKRKISETGGIEPGWTVSAIYWNIDCVVQPINRKDMEQLQFAPAGLIGPFDKTGFVPRYQKVAGSDSPEELIFLDDDQLEVTISSSLTEKYRIKRVDRYDTHYELLLEQIKE